MAQGGELGPTEKIRDALAVVAVLVAVGALAFAVSAFVQSGGPGETVQAIAGKTANVQTFLKTQDEKVSELSGKLAALDARLTELSENADGILAGGRKPAQEEVVKLVQKEVQSNLQKKIDELGRSGLPARRSKDQEFDAMAASMIRACGAGNKAREVRKILDGMRADLKQLGRNLQPPKKTPWPEFQKRAAPARNKHLARLRQILPPDQYKKFEGWMRSTKDSYAKTFFGR